MSGVLATPMLVNATANNSLPTGPSDNSDAPMVLQSNLSSVPQRTKNTHYCAGTHGTEVVTVYGSPDAVHWVSLGTITPASNPAQLTTDGIFPYFTHVISGVTTGTNVSSWVA